MHCHPVIARPNWRENTADLGYDISLLEDPAYWIEAIDNPFCCVFSEAEITRIEAATIELTKLALELVQEVCCSATSEKFFDQLHIPDYVRETIRTSWKRHDRSLYGRFDFAFHDDSLKLLELNFDTPTSLYESAHLQRLWLEDLLKTNNIPADASQCNSLQEKLQSASRKFIAPDRVFHFGTFKHAVEEAENLRYLQSCAVSAGVKTQFIYLDDIRYDQARRLVDLEGRAITCLFKLFPWELLFLEDAKAFASSGNYLFAPLIDSNSTSFIEPVWKSILSNKAALPLMWQLAPNHPLLLAASFDDDSAESIQLRRSKHVRKPLFGREGSGISIIGDSHEKNATKTEAVVASNSQTEAFIFQEFARLQKHENYHLVLGSWIVNDEPAGISVRADRSEITGRQALFVPHYVVTNQVCLSSPI